MAEFDTGELLAEVRQRGGLGSADSRFTDTLLLAASTRELREGIAPLLWDAGAEWNVYPYTQSVAAGVSSVRLPARAAGGRLRKLTWVDGGANEFPLVEVGPEDVRLLNAGAGTPAFYFVRNFSVVLSPTPNAAGTLSTPFYARPNALVLSSAVGTIASVNGTAITLAATKPSSMQVGTLVDIVRATPGFETSLAANALTAASGTSLTLTTAAPSEVAPGDYVCLAGQAPVPQLPVELMGLLAIRAARRACEDAADFESAKRLDDRVAESEEMSRHWLTPRVDGNPKQAGDAWGGLLYGHGGWGLGWY